MKLFYTKKKEKKLENNRVFHLIVHANVHVLLKLCLLLVLCLNETVESRLDPKRENRK